MEEDLVSLSSVASKGGSYLAAYLDPVEERNEAHCSWLGCEATSATAGIHQRRSNLFLCDEHNKELKQLQSERRRLKELDALGTSSRRGGLTAAAVANLTSSSSSAPRTPPPPSQQPHSQMTVRTASPSGSLRSPFRSRPLVETVQELAYKQAEEAVFRTVPPEPVLYDPGSLKLARQSEDDMLPLLAAQFSLCPPPGMPRFPRETTVFSRFTQDNRLRLSWSSLVHDTSLGWTMQVRFI